MSTFIPTYSLDLNNLKLTDGDYTKAEDWEELICENEGSFSKDEEYMIFDSNGIEIVINYELSVSGRVDYDPGDYYTPPYSDFDITYEDIFILSWSRSYDLSDMDKKVDRVYDVEIDGEKYYFIFINNDDNEWSVISEDPMKLEKLLRDKKLFFTGEVKIVE